MDSFSVDDLTEEVFGHLCNIAIDKCNDKMEKRKAGCGGKAMRKRVLIKNFVSELFKTHNERTGEEDEDEMYDCEEHEFSDDSEADTTICEEEDVEMDLMDDSEKPPKTDCWLSGSPDLSSSQYSDYISGSSLLSSGRDGAEGRLDHVVVSPDARLSLYDLYSNMSEKATEGGQPEASSPTETTFMPTVPANGYESPYDLSLSTVRYDLESLSSSLGDVADHAHLQPVTAEASDQLFLSLNNNCYSEMKTYTPLTDTSSSMDDVMTPPPSSELTDLDAPQQTDSSSPKKRRSDEISLYESIAAQVGHQKRIKL